MSRKTWSLILGLFIAGALLGGVSVEIYNQTHFAQSKELFNERLRCNGLAQRYAETRTGSARHGTVAYMVRRVDYSESRTSCIAEMDLTYSSPAPIADERALELVDLATNEVLEEQGCSGDCSDLIGWTENKFRGLIKR